MRSFCVAPHIIYRAGAKCDARGGSFAFGGRIERCIFQNSACALFDLQHRKYDELPRSLIMNSALAQKSICVVSVCRSVAHTPSHIHPRDQSTRRIKLLPRRKCRSAHPFALQKRGCCATLSEMISAVARYCMLCYCIWPSSKCYIYEFEIRRLECRSQRREHFFWKQSKKTPGDDDLIQLTNKQTDPHC
jgi:hypothetical protein